MEAETQKKIEETVNEILKTADMEVMTEYKVRNIASEKLGIDLSVPHHKSFVRYVVESFIRERKAESEEPAAEQPEQQPQQQPVEEEEEKEEEEEEEQRGTKRSAGVKEYDDLGDRIICHLSDKRRVTIQEFKGKTLVSVREYYKKDGKMLPTSKGISLTVDQWLSFKKNVPDIEKAIRKLRG
ncbi:hypothetical protein Dimus_007857 [Dionaea muscipula]